MPDHPSHETVLPVDEGAFRALMSQFATGVCVVAAIGDDADEEGASCPVGITVNSFVSVSLDPMLVCWSLHNSSSQFDIWTGKRAFSISILAQHQHAIALRYAARDKIADPADFVIGKSGLPHIGGALGHLECRPYQTYPAGDHTMILGEVTGLYLDGDSGGKEASDESQPLLFFKSGFRSIAAA